jgi:hypothetical protein
VTSLTDRYATPPAGGTPWPIPLLLLMMMMMMIMMMITMTMMTLMMLWQAACYSRRRSAVSSLPWRRSS